MKKITPALAAAVLSSLSGSLAGAALLSVRSTGTRQGAPGGFGIPGDLVFIGRHVRIPFGGFLFW
jgi:hypothetical protein